MSKQREGHGIAWTQETWNPVRGCSRVSPGCGQRLGKGKRLGGCYAEKTAGRFCKPGEPPDEEVNSRYKQHRFPDGTLAYSVGKKAAGDLLDGVLYHEYPRGVAQTNSTTNTDRDEESVNG